MIKRSRVQGAAWGNGKSIDKVRTGNDNISVKRESTVVNVQPGMVLLRSALDIELQKWLIGVAFEIGRTTEINSEGFYVDDPKHGHFVLNQGTRGRVIKSAGEFPAQFNEVCLQMLEKACSADSTLPKMEPNTVLINYYNERAHFKWHKDSEDPDLINLNQGKPIISFSIGLSAEFCYKSRYEDEKHNSLCLNSGDVLIFGGPSRMIVHSIQQIHSRTMPGPLLSSVMRSGRLNITVRDIGRGHLDKSQFPKYRVIYDNVNGNDTQDE